MPDQYYDDSRGSMSSDPVSRRLLVAVLLLVVLILGLVGYAVYAGLLRPQAPRTAVERDVLMLEAEVRRNPKGAEAWMAYVSGLSAAGQRSAALRAISDGIRALDDASPMLALRAQIEHAQGSDDLALASASEAVKAAEKYRKKIFAEMERKGILTSPVPSDAIIESEVLRADIYGSRHKYPEAVRSYTRALQEDPTMADVLARRGGVRSEMGDRVGARKDYEAALRYDPTNVEAVAGLRRIGDGK